MHAYRDQYATLFRDGQNVVLIAISADPVDTLAAWARDDQFPFLFASDTGGVVGKRYGPARPTDRVDHRNLFVVTADGKVAYRQTPFQELDPTAYTELAAALEQIVRR
jgi:peroxiredoxin